jgi:hypothetical protein
MKKSQADAAAWAAVFRADVGALDEALASGANPLALHPVAGHDLLSQAAKSVTKACEMSAVLIERGASVPQPGQPLAQELIWHAMLQDHVILAKKLMDVSDEWAKHFLAEKDRCVLAGTPRLDMFLHAKAAFSAIDRFNREFAPHMQPGAPAVKTSMARMGP